jgi:transposase
MDMLQFATIKSVAGHLHLTWDTVKEIHKRRLARRYTPLDIRGVRNIGIDEFAVRKGHVYKTIVVDLDTGRIIHVGDGKGADALRKFWKRVDHYGVVIEHIATDLSRAYIASVMENAPVAVHVFDHFHVVKLMNEALDELRARVYRKETELNGRKVVKGIRWLLLCNGDDIFDEKHKTRLENALAMNKPLAQAYYLKESLREIWAQSTKAAASQVLEEWLEQARSTKIPLIIKVANTIAAHRTGILAWYDCNISTAKVEGINNKIKVLKREAYGFRDERYFKLRLYDLHNKGITSFLG